MWLMLQQDEPADYVVASGETHSVRELVALAFEHVSLDAEEYVQIDSSLERGKAELHDLIGDPSKARERLGWERTVGFEELVHRLVDADFERLRLSTQSPAERGAP
jgi:GDPmannose 4,6-dehydratase